MTTVAPPARTSSAAQARWRAPSGRRVFVGLLRERLRERQMVPVVWGGSFGAMGALMVLVWPSIRETVGTLIASYPEELLKAFGITGFHTVGEYVDGELFGLLVPFAAALLVVRCVIAPVAGAEDSGQLDTWLALPVPRRALMWSAFVAAGAVLAATMAVMWAVTMTVGVLSGAGLSGWALGRGTVDVWALAMVAGGIAVLVSGAARGAARANAVAMAALVAMYLVNLAGTLATGLADLRYASAFRYYGGAIERGLDPWHVIGLTAAAVTLAAIGTEAFERRDV